jgi:protease I
MKAVIVTGRLAQDIEAIYPLYRLQESGFEVDVAVRGRQPCTGISGLKIEPTRDIPQVDETYAYELLILPGGVKAMEHMRLDDGLLDFIAAYHASGGVIGSICSGAQLLISAGLCKNRTISAYPAMRVDVENAGGRWHPGPVVNFDRIVSAPHYRDLGPWMKEVIQAAGSERGWTKQPWVGLCEGL